MYLYAVSFWAAAKRARDISLSRLAAAIIFILFLLFCFLFSVAWHVQRFVSVCPTVLRLCGVQKRNPIRSCQ